jgi:hypothetical protein
MTAKINNTEKENKELEFTIRNILGLHLNNFYQENGLSVPCKTRTITEDKIITALMPFINSKDEELKKSNEELERIKSYLRIGLIERDDYISKYNLLKLKSDALETSMHMIANWHLPSTGQFWENDKTRPMSYEAAYGSQGVQAYIKTVANEALIKYWEKPEDVIPKNNIDIDYKIEEHE